MQRETGRMWKWRQRVAYRLLARPARVAWDAEGESAPVRLDYPDADIWLRATSAPERKWRARACAKEPWTVQWIREHVARGEVVYDIGANVGAFSLIAASRGASVVAFEPGYANFARLCENIQLNDCGAAVVPVPLPLNDSPGIVSFKYRSLEPGQSRHALGEGPFVSRAGGGARFVQPVCATTLDHAVTEFGLAAPHHLKIDVDGSELRVLRGGASVLRGPQLRTILIESDAGDWDAVAAALADGGFALRTRHERAGKNDAPLYGLWTR